MLQGFELFKIDGGHDKRIQNAKWHISYFTDEDKVQIEKVMKKAGCTNYQLYQSIDECIDYLKNRGITYE